MTAFLDSYQEKLAAFVRNPASWDIFWKATASGIDGGLDEATATHINKLEIPSLDVCLGPNLLLHNLGSEMVERAVVDGVFDGKSQSVTTSIHVLLFLSDRKFG